MTSIATEAPMPAMGISALLDDNPMMGEPKVGPRRFWTTREERILRETYPVSGVPGCVPLLPGRSAKSIYNRVNQMGLRSKKHAPGPRQRWLSSPEIDALIVRTYADPTEGAIKALARSLGRPRWWVGGRARRIGCAVPRFKEAPWTEAEINFIAERAHRDPTVIQRGMAKKGWKRTATAIAVKLKRIGVTREDPNHFTATGLARMMGVDAKAVTAWIAKGWLRAQRRGTERCEAQGGDQWWIARGDVRKFVIGNAAAVDLRKVDKFWFIDLMAERAAA